MSSRTIHNPKQGDTATFLATASETRGDHTLIEIDVNAGGGAPEHYHTEFDEEIIAIDGPIRVTVEGRVLILQPGERYTVPRGVRHSWKNAETTAAKFQARLTPGHTGFENFLRVVYGLGRDDKLSPAGMPKDFSALALVVRWGDTNLPGPLSLLNPVLRWKAQQAEKSGLGQQLLNKYDGEIKVVSR